MIRPSTTSTYKYQYQRLTIFRIYNVNATQLPCNNQKRILTNNASGRGKSFSSCTTLRWTSSTSNIKHYNPVNILGRGGAAGGTSQDRGNVLNASHPKRYFASSSSISNPLWNLLSGSFNPINPIIQDLDFQPGSNVDQNQNDDHDGDGDGDDDGDASATNNEKNYTIPISLKFDTYQPFHFPQAAKRIQTTYEKQLTQLEETLLHDQQQHDDDDDDDDDEINSHKRDFLLEQLDKIIFPIYTFQNVLVLYTCMKDSSSSSYTNNLDSTWSDALSEASNIIKFKHESSFIIHDALKKYEQLLLVEQTNDDDDNHEKKKERLCVLRNLLRQQHMKGIHNHGTTTDITTNNNETIQTIQKLNARITSLEIDFLTFSSYTMEQHGKITPTQKILPYLYEILSLKQHRAKILGYNDYLEYSFNYHSCMVQNRKEIEDLHESLLLRCNNDNTLNDESDDFLTTSMQNDGSAKTTYKDYFELNHVLNEMFGLCSILFDITIEEEKDGYNNNINAWNKDVRLFHIYQGSNDDNDDDIHNSNDFTKTKGKKKKIASFYMDPFRRINKEWSEFMAPIIYKSTTKTQPLCVISLQARPPTWDDSPVQLELKDVVHLFHEFGHLLQSTLVNVDMGLFCGTQSMEEDASEVVSQVSWIICLVFVAHYSHALHLHHISSDIIVYGKLGL